MRGGPWLRYVLPVAVMLPFLLPPAAGTARPAEAGPSAEPGVRTLYLVRHGHYDFRDPADPRVGKRLTDLGRTQARRVARRLASLPVTYGGVRTSRFTRAMQTGDVIGKVLDLRVTRDDLLNECMPDSARYGAPGGAEAARAADEQLEAAWTRYARPSPEGDIHQVIAGHGNVIRWFAARAIGADTRLWANMDVANGGLTIVTIHPDGSARLVTLNDVGHLPPAKQTWAGDGPGW